MVCTLEVSPPARMDLEYWVNVSTFHNLYGIDPQWLEWCIPDASDTGYGGYRMQHGDHVAQAS